MIGNGFRIGRLYGINIRVDWSWILILLLITWNLVTALSQVHPTWGMPSIWGISLLAALLFFASVLAHEMAHSLVARSQGLPVRNITLFLFGGVSNIQREPESPKDEFWMAIAGPLTSLAIGIVMLAVAVGSVVLGNGFGRGIALANLSPAATILLWLGSVNVILAVFNLIPGFPLDGGRVLRSIFWAVTKNIRRATRWAAWIGQAIAWVMIGAGIAMAFGVSIPFFGTGIVSGLWLAFIGWFLNSASSQSYQQVAVQDILDGVPVARLMRANPTTVEPDCTVDDLVHSHLMNSDDQAFPVMKNEQLVGIVTLDDMRKVLRDAWTTTRVADIMTTADKLITVDPDEDAAAAMEKLIERDVRQLPVVRRAAAAPGTAAIPVTGAANGSGAQLLGLLRRRDIMRYLQLQSSDQKNDKKNNA